MSFSTYYDSQDVGLSGTANTAGSMVAFLDKVLVNGYNSTVLTSLTSVGTLCTATLTNHGYRDRQFVTISGATPSAYNGTFQIIVGSATPNTFQFNALTSPGSSATGTLACIVTSLGYTIPFTGTNLRSYRASVGNRFYMAIDDTGTTTCRCIGYETMTGVTTGTNLFPTTVQLSAGVFISKANAAGPRRVILTGNQSAFWMFVDYTGDSSAGTVSFFGDGTSFLGGDNFFTCNFAQSAAAGFEGSSWIQGGLGGTSFIALLAHYIARSYTAVTGSVTANKLGNWSFETNQTTSTNASPMGGLNGTMPYPVVSDGNMWVAPITVTEAAAATPRGMIPGMIAPMHNRPLADYAIFQGAGGLTGKEYIVISCGGTGQVFFEVSNTW